MAPSKKSVALPKGWQSDIVYLHSPAYSAKLSADKIEKLVVSRTTLPMDTEIYRVSGPYTNVKITRVVEPSHPAYDQHALCSTQHLLPDTLILPYLGYVHDSNDSDPKSDYDLSLERELSVGVDASRMGNEARYVNDYRRIAASANAEFRDIYVDIGDGKVEKRVGVFVLSAGKSGKRAKGIARGQEILVSYGKGFWTERQASET